MQYEEIKELIKIFEKTDLNDLELTMDNVSLRLKRGAEAAPAYGVPSAGEMPASQASAAPAVTVEKQEEPVPVLAQPVAGPEESSAVPNTPVVPNSPAVPNTPAIPNSVATSNGPAAEGTLIKAPIVGTFYASSAPDKPPFVKVGDTVAEDDILCIIEAMKFMNEVPSERGGTIAEIFVKDGEFVEFGQPLFRIV